MFLHQIIFKYSLDIFQFTFWHLSQDILLGKAWCEWFDENNNFLKSAGTLLCIKIVSVGFVNKFVREKCDFGLSNVSI